MVRRFLIAVVLTFAGSVPQSAHAYWGFGGGYGTNYYGYGLPMGWYTGVNSRVPPYFSLHPPVYYSGQITRIPYGASPFANFPSGASFQNGGAGGNVAPSLNARLAAASPVESVTIENPFFAAKNGGTGASTRGAVATAPSPLESAGVLIMNPYYQGDVSVASAKR